MSAIGKVIQALLLAGATVYFIPYLAQGARELLNEIKEDKR